MTEPPAPQRRPRDAALAQAAILDAAEAMFAEHGFAGARIQAIAARAGYNTGMIFHYFGDKLGLYTAVIQRADAQLSVILGRLLAAVAADAADDAITLRPLLEDSIAAMFTYLIEHPQFCRLLLWEQAQGWQTFARIAEQFPVQARDPFVHFVRRAYTAGLLRTEFHPVIQLGMMLQVCLAYLAALPAFQLGLPPATDLASAAALADARAYVVSFVVHGMLRDDAAQTPP